MVLKQAFNMNEKLRSNVVNDLGLTFCDLEQSFSLTEKIYLTFEATHSSLRIPNRGKLFK